MTLLVLAALVLAVSCLPPLFADLLPVFAIQSSIVPVLALYAQPTRNLPLHVESEMDIAILKRLVMESETIALQTIRETPMRHAHLQALVSLLDDVLLDLVLELTSFVSEFAEMESKLKAKTVTHLVTVVLAIAISSNRHMFAETLLEYAILPSIVPDRTLLALPMSNLPLFAVLQPEFATLLSLVTEFQTHALPKSTWQTESIVLATIAV